MVFSENCNRQNMQLHVFSFSWTFLYMETCLGLGVTQIKLGRKPWHQTPYTTQVQSPESCSSETYTQPALRIRVIAFETQTVCT